MSQTRLTYTPNRRKIRTMKNFISTIAFLVTIATAGCTNPAITNVICGPGKIIIGPDADACILGVLAAAKSIPMDIATCGISPASGACIDAIISSGADLLACKPVCASAPSTNAQAVARTPLQIAPNVLRTNIIEAFKSRGYANAGQ